MILWFIISLVMYIFLAFLINYFIINLFCQFNDCLFILINRGDVISLVVKSLKNPRSAVCKTAIMASADIFNAYNDLIIESLDPLVNCFLQNILPRHVTLSLTARFLPLQVAFFPLNMSLILMYAASSTTSQVFTRQAICMWGSWESFSSNDNLGVPYTVVTKIATIS